ncbi:tetratricopeptide repeat protein [Tundrisphaera lichenicola]|uniref:tetratricopeptide repeat protein n=1 Tax=Tundrisphaera lichenicola TaxID=2029860 RepID=UPI003EBB8ADF
MPRRETDRNLLFGILALQMDFINRDALVASMNAWVLQKHRPLGEILVERGDLDPADRALLDPMVDRHIAKHGGDPVASLAALSSTGGVASDLRREVADADVQASLATIPPSRLDYDAFATQAASTPEPAPIGIRYQKGREHARGNLGVVFVARDTELNREVALKEIKDQHADHPHHRSRFLIEAEVTGGLEHPGIVPVYGLGHHEDGRPFYAMRFIRGDSLMEAINRFHADPTLRTDPGERNLALQKLLRRFTDVCNAIDYAHSRGILHRDLKPHNVMVGKYGETLVVDWGLAKAVARSGDDGDTLPEASLSPASASASDATLPGSLVGTPAYMSPEQAAGRLDLLGPASDIYGLGATLYHLLTGRIPVNGKGLAEILRKVETGDIPPPRAASPWLDPALAAISQKAMALRPEARYATPRALAEDVERWVAGEPVTAYPEPLSRRVRRWARRYRTSLTAAATTLTVSAFLVGGFSWQRMVNRQKSDVSASAGMGRAERLAIQARASGELARWAEAIAEVRHAEALLESGGTNEMLRKASDRLRDYRAEVALREEALLADARDRQTLADLEEARLLGSNIKHGSFDEESKQLAYLTAFRSRQIDPASMAPPEAAARIRSTRIAGDLIAAIDDWAGAERPNVPRAALLEVARLAETDPVLAEIRDAVTRGDAPRLRQFCEREEDRRKLGPRLRPVFYALCRIDPEASFPLLEAIRQENPSDFWFNHELADACWRTRPTRSEEGVRYSAIATALRPRSAGAHANYAFMLRAAGEKAKAVSIARRAVQLQPDYHEAYQILGLALLESGDKPGAIAACREAIRLKPEYPFAHNALGCALEESGDIAGAIAAYREAIRLKPDFSYPHNNLGAAFSKSRDRVAALAAYRDAVRVAPDFAVAIQNLAETLEETGDRAGAIAAYRDVLRARPDFYDTYMNLANALEDSGDVAGAMDTYRELLRLRPKHVPAHNRLGLLLEKSGDHEGAISIVQEAIRLAPEFAMLHFNLGIALNEAGRHEAAIAAYREAIRLKPDDPDAHLNLGVCLNDLGRTDEAIASYREALRLAPGDALTLCNLGRALGERGHFQEALTYLERGHELGLKEAGWDQPSADWVAFYRRAIRQEPRLQSVLRGEARPADAAERVAFADICYRQGRHSIAVRLLEEAFAERPDLAEDLASSNRFDGACSAALAASGIGEIEPVPDEPTRAKFREEARAWLRADLAAWAKRLEGGQAKDREEAAEKLADWKTDLDLASIRDRGSLINLPKDEREAFQSLWADVEALRKKANQAASGGDR